MAARRERFLREMGITPVWRLRTSTSIADEVSASPLMTHEKASAPTGNVRPADTPVAGRKVRDVAHIPHPEPTRPTPGGTRDAAVEAVDKLDWPELENAMAACQACRLCETRRHVVPGTGDRQARLLLVGEGPGAEEDRRGLPFVGAAGQLLDAMLAAVGLNRESGVYIANTVKCRPPLNRTPQEDEIAACAPFLERQIALLQPDLIVALGRPAAQRLLGQPVRINAARGRHWTYREHIPVIVTYHPAYLLRNPEDKAKAWSDLCMIRNTLDS